jgi:hypothetical protein
MIRTVEVLESGGTHSFRRNVRQSSEILGPGVFFLRVEPCQVPSMSYFGGISLPHFQEQNSPKRHENGEEDRCRIVKQIRNPTVKACFRQMPVIAKVITNWAHGYVDGARTNLLTGTKEVTYN